MAKRTTKLVFGPHSKKLPKILNFWAISCQKRKNTQIIGKSQSFDPGWGRRLATPALDDSESSLSRRKIFLSHMQPIGAQIGRSWSR
jgi:hypothetical protein